MPTVGERAEKLRALVRLLSDAAETVIKEWELEEQTGAVAEGDADKTVLPSPALYEARRVFVGACGMGMSLVQNQAQYLSEVSASFFNALSVRVAAEARVADVLDNAGADGMFVGDISKQVGIAEQQLTRILRCLCSIHVFDEVKEDHYANNAISQRLVRNEGLRCYLLIHTIEVYSASERLPTVLFNRKEQSAWQEAYGVSTDFWTWVDEESQRPDGTVVARPERATWTTGMWGYGLEGIQAPGVGIDYPWERLGSCTVVDVGAGTRGTSLGLAKKFPHMRIVVQDRPVVVKEAEAVWMTEIPDAIVSGRVRLMTHNFFEAQPIQGADVYTMRHILHDWADDECVVILTHLRKAMGPHSVILNIDNVMQSTAGSRYHKHAPAPLPPNYGYAHSFANHHDLYMYSMFNGGERTVEQFSALASRAGLKVTKLWECRGLSYVTEMMVAD